MAFSQMTDDLDIIAKYPDEPYEEEGFTSAAFKASFDRGAKLCKAAHNALVRALNGVNASFSVGFRRSSAIPADNVQAAIESVQAQIQQFVQDEAVIPNGSITGEKIADRTILGVNIRALQIGKEHLKSESVDSNALCDKAVTVEKLDDYSVTNDKLADEAVTVEKLDYDLQTAIKEKYDVGDIFITTRDGDPSGLVGYGTWFQIADRFLLASGTRQVGDSGGEETHTLTTDEMPSHSHKVRYVGNGANGVYGGQPGTSVDAEPNYNGLILAPEGGGQPHNNMPPYFVVNIWLRIA